MVVKPEAHHDVIKETRAGTPFDNFAVALTL
jgi:hypothetical protein